MRVAHLASEVVPFSKTGGLADVVGALPPAIADLGHEVTVVVPAHRSTLDDPVPGKPRGEVSALGYTARVSVLQHRGIRVVFLDSPALYVRPALYSLADQDYPDNPVRFAFFARAALAAIAKLGGAEVVHAHDWQAALAPLLLRHDGKARFAMPAARTVLTIHNLAYQGAFAPWALEACGLPRRALHHGRARVLRRRQLSQGGVGERRRDHHRLSDLRPRDPLAAVRVRPGRGRSPPAATP